MDRGPACAGIKCKPRHDAAAAAHGTRMRHMCSWTAHRATQLEWGGAPGSCMARSGCRWQPRHAGGMLAARGPTKDATLRGGGLPPRGRVLVHVVGSVPRGAQGNTTNIRSGGRGNGGPLPAVPGAGRQGIPVARPSRSPTEAAGGAGNATRHGSPGEVAVEACVRQKSSPLDKPPPSAGRPPGTSPW